MSINFSSWASQHLLSFCLSWNLDARLSFAIFWKPQGLPNKLLRADKGQQTLPTRGIVSPIFSLGTHLDTRCMNYCPL
jgi:hypothetical protein